MISNKLVRLDDVYAASRLGAVKVIVVSSADQGWYKICWVVRADCFVPVDAGYAHLVADLF